MEPAAPNRNGNRLRGLCDDAGVTSPQERAAAVVRTALADSGAGWDEPSPGTFTVTVPGARKLSTGCVLSVGQHALAIHAFVARAPEENQAAVYRFLLERNLRQYAVTFAVDHHGDIHLVGKVALPSVSEEEVDRLLGAVCAYADDAFNPILELGFASSIRREWEWRIARGESTANLEAFRHLLYGR